MIIDYEYSTRITYNPGIERHDILLRCLPSDEPFQLVDTQTFRITGCFTVQERLDCFLNKAFLGGTKAFHTELSYLSSGRLRTSVYCIPDQEPHPMYRYHDPVKASEQVLREMKDVAAEASKQNPLQGALMVMHYVHSYLTYSPGVTTFNTPLDEIVRLRQGVCQDYAHLMVMLCRMAGFHARYACGLMRGEGQTHAWVEVHDGQCWYAFDPTNDTAVATGYVKLAHGRNALDCPVSRGVFAGIADSSMTVSCKVTVISDEQNQ